jgi:hypothetical protein
MGKAMTGTEGGREEDFTDSVGWQYRSDPPEGDQRKLVWLEQDHVCWIGIRVWQTNGRRWINNNEPERAVVLCWMNLPEKPQRFWSRGKLLPELQR